MGKEIKWLLLMAFLIADYISVNAQNDSLKGSSDKGAYIGVSGNLLLPVDNLTFLREKEISPWNGVNMFTTGGFNIFAGYDVNKWFGLRQNIINMFTPTHVSYPYTGQNIYRKRIKKDWGMIMSTDMIFKLKHNNFSMGLSPGIAYGFLFSEWDDFDYPSLEPNQRTNMLYAAYGLKLGLITRYDIHKNIGLFIDVEFYNMSIDLRRINRYEPSDSGWDWSSRTTYEGLRVSVKPFSYWNLSLGAAYRFNKKKQS